MTARPCLCGTCGRTFDRPRSLPLCKAGTARVYAFIRELVPNDLSERQRVSNRVFADAKTVVAVLAGDLAEVERRIEHRAVYGLYASPDTVVLTGAS